MTTADYAPRNRDHRNRCPVHGGPLPCPACDAHRIPPPDWFRQRHMTNPTPKDTP